MTKIRDLRQDDCRNNRRGLTNKQNAIVDRLLEGKTLKELSHELSINSKTSSQHVRSILSRHMCENLTQLGYKLGKDDTMAEAERLLKKSFVVSR